MAIIARIATIASIVVVLATGTFARCIPTAAWLFNRRFLMVAAKRKAKSATAKSARRSDAAMSRLKRRVGDLVLEYVAVGRATTKLKGATRKLRADINAWRDRTGRDDLRATPFSRQEGGHEFSCSDCKMITTDIPGRVCVLTGCDPEWNNCSYVCFTVPRDPDYPVS